MKKIKFALKITAVLSVILFLFACSPIENDSESNSILILSQILGKSIDGDNVDFLQSDVVTIDSTTGQEIIAADTAKASLTAKRIEPALPTGSSQYNSIMVTRYVVYYSRSDKPNAVEGVDVPYSFEGYLSTLIEIDSTVDISFVIVREAAKLEAPLISLRQGGAERILEITANVDFYGHDLANKPVKKVSGKLSIFFANYADQ